MTTIHWPDPDFLYKWVKSKGWENMSELEKYLVRKACKSEMELVKLMLGQSTPIPIPSSNRIRTEDCEGKGKRQD